MDSVNVGAYRVDLGCTQRGEWYWQVIEPSTQFDERNGEQITPDRKLRTERGYESRQSALGAAVGWLDEYYSGEEDDYPEEEAPHCGCRFCHCFNYTTAGETCNSCLMGEHQG